MTRTCGVDAPGRGKSPSSKATILRKGYVYNDHEGDVCRRRFTSFSQLQEALREKAQVSTLQPKLKLEFRDLDCLTTVEEVIEAIRKALPNCETDPKVILTKANSRQVKMAFVEINEHYALELLKTARIKVGWVNSRIRKRLEVTRCYRCFGYGHRQATCSEPDRRKEGVCMGCGEKGHLKKNCTNKPRCFLCSAENARDHVAGSGKCGVFRAHQWSRQETSS
ncbi:hypothetical protein Trydic_g53 [Trypoxylus dichotomus]